MREERCISAFWEGEGRISGVFIAFVVWFFGEDGEDELVGGRWFNCIVV